jgi:ribulose-bisphosphate carboxylase large chain
MDRSDRYADLSLNESNLIANQRHILVAYIMKPKAGFGGYLATAAHFAAESSTGTNVSVSTTDDFTRGVDAMVYGINEAENLVKIAFPVELFGRNIIDGRAMLCLFLTLCIGNRQGKGDVEHANIRDFHVPPRFLRLFDGPSTTISDLWRMLERPVIDGGFIVGTIIKPKLGLRPRPFANACHNFWLGGDFIKNDEQQGSQMFAPLKETIPLVADAMNRAQGETGEAKLFSANITADDHYEMVARSEFILETFGENADHVAFLVDGYVPGPAAITTARRTFPNQHLSYHRAGHGAVTSPSAMRGHTAFGLFRMARMPGFFNNLSHANLILTAGAFGISTARRPGRRPCVRPGSAGKRVPIRSNLPRITKSSPARSRASKATRTRFTPASARRCGSIPPRDCPAWVSPTLPDNVGWVTTHTSTSAIGYPT